MCNLGSIPQIDFQYVTNNFVYKLTRRPFNLTATVVSNLNLSSLYWSPPEYSRPLPNKTITVHNGNVTTTTFMLLKNATLGDYGNYTLTAVNKCGQNSSEVLVDVLTGKIIDYLLCSIVSSKELKGEKFVLLQFCKQSLESRK